MSWTSVGRSAVVLLGWDLFMACARFVSLRTASIASCAISRCQLRTSPGRYRKVAGDQSTVSCFSFLGGSSRFVLIVHFSDDLVGGLWDFGTVRHAPYYSNFCKFNYATNEDVHRRWRLKTLILARTVRPPPLSSSPLHLPRPRLLSCCCPVLNNTRSACCLGRPSLSPLSSLTEESSKEWFVGPHCIRRQ